MHLNKKVLEVSCYLTLNTLGTYSFELKNIMPVAETDRLILSKFTLKDAPFFLELVNTPNWVKYIGNRNTITLEQAKERIKTGHLENYKNLSFGFYKVLLKEENNKPIGTCGLIKREELEDVDIGFGFFSEYEGKGFGFEASTELLKLAKNKFSIKKISAITLPTNTNSIKLIEKLGLTFDKKFKPFKDDDELLLFVKDL